MNPRQQHNLKVDSTTQRFLKLIAAHTGEKQYAVLTRVLAAEWQRVQQQDGTLRRQKTSDLETMPIL